MILNNDHTLYQTNVYNKNIYENIKNSVHQNFPMGVNNSDWHA